MPQQICFSFSLSRLLPPDHLQWKVADSKVTLFVKEAVSVCLYKCESVYWSYQKFWFHCTKCKYFITANAKVFEFCLRENTISTLTHTLTQCKYIAWIIKSVSVSYNVRLMVSLILSFQTMNTKSIVLFVAITAVLINPLATMFLGT